MITHLPAVSLMATLALALAALSDAGGAEYRSPHALILYDGISERHARAIARTVDAARQACIDRYDFDMPDLITVRIVVRPNERVRLFNDGVDTFSLTLRSDQDLQKPATTGTFHLYGLCHEVAHLAMYRPVKDRGWLTTAGAEGWAHFLGSHLVDMVYDNEGADLWPDPYDYRADGNKRLRDQIASRRASDTVKGAELWQEFELLVGREKLASIFDAWGKAEVDPANPRSALQDEVVKLGSDAAKVAAWFERANPVVFLKRPGSKFALRQVATQELTGSSQELANDDGKAAGKRSFAGGGHAVRFEVPDNSWHVTSVSLHGSRYGTPRAPMEQFSVWLCDEEFRPITEFKFAYSRFKRGEAKWEKFETKPTAVPPKFIVCFGFNPSAQKGVYVSHDAAGSGASFSGLPGRPMHDFTAGDWLIRVEVDQAKTSDALSLP